MNNEYSGKMLMSRLSVLLLSLVLAACAAGGAGTSIGLQEPSKASNGAELEKKWGIRVESLRLSAGDYMLDFRYRVVDEEKAKYVLDRRNKPVLTDQNSKARFVSPTPAKIGSLRQSTMQPEAGRVYFIIFANPGKYVKRGNPVTIEIGELSARDIIVE